MAKRETLNARQLAFVLAYTSGPTRGNATQSARAAGYTGTDETLSVTGARLLGNPKVSSELQRRAAPVERRASVDAAEARDILSEVIRNGPIGEKVKALGALAKMNGWFSFVHRHEGSGGGAIVHEVRMTLADAKVLAKEKP